MVRIYILRVSLLLPSFFLQEKSRSRAQRKTFGAGEHRRGTGSPSPSALFPGQRTLEDALKRFPGSVQLRLELGRFYVYQRRDARH